MMGLSPQRLHPQWREPKATGPSPGDAPTFSPIPPLRSPKARGVPQPIPPSLLLPAPPNGARGQDARRGGAQIPLKDVFLALGRSLHSEHCSTPCKAPLASSYRATKPQGSPGAGTQGLLLANGRNEKLSVLVSSRLPSQQHSCPRSS